MFLDLFEYFFFFDLEIWWGFIIRYCTFPQMNLWTTKVQFLYLWTDLNNSMGKIKILILIKGFINEQKSFFSFIKINKDDIHKLRSCFGKVGWKKTKPILSWIRFLMTSFKKEKKLHSFKHFKEWGRMCHFLKPLKLTQELRHKMSYSSELLYGSCFYDVY